MEGENDGQETAFTTVSTTHCKYSRFYVAFLGNLSSFFVVISYHYWETPIIGNGLVDSTGETGDVKRVHAWELERGSGDHPPDAVIEARLCISDNLELEVRRTAPSYAHHARLVWLVVSSCDTRFYSLDKALSDVEFRLSK